MKLFDFTADEQLNKLRDLMGAEQFGRFELFDSNLHLSWQERQLLAKQWVIIESNIFHAGAENILYFKNSPVVIKIENTFHFALCDDVKKRISQGKMNGVDATTCTKLMNGASNCSYCLHAVSYEGYDAYRHRHQQYNDAIIKHFNLSEFITSKSPVFKS